MAAQLPEVRTIQGRTRGPRLALLGGVHGDEFEGVIAARRVADLLHDIPFNGSLVYAAPAHPAAWRESCRESPLDGKNLARVFPGDPQGSPTEQIAAHLTAELITGSDLVIDLHSAGKGFDMPLLAGYHSAGPLAEAAGAAASAFGAPFLWQHPGLSVGRSLSAAAALGIPSFYVETRGGGGLRRHDVNAYVTGVQRTMAHLGMIDPDDITLPPVGPSTVVRGDGNTDEGMTSAADGYFVSSSHVGEAVDVGAEIGLVIDDRGATVATVTAQQRGIVMLLRRTAPVTLGDTLAIVAEIPESPSLATRYDDTRDQTDPRR